MFQFVRHKNRTEIFVCPKIGRPLEKIGERTENESESIYDCWIESNVFDAVFPTLSEDIGTEGMSPPDEQNYSVKCKYIDSNRWYACVYIMCDYNKYKIAYDMDIGKPDLIAEFFTVKKDEINYFEVLDEAVMKVSLRGA